MEQRYLEAIERFRALFERARGLDLNEPSAMTLATADAGGSPSVRTVLLKQVDERGFVFYTNTRSRKGRQLGENPRAALCFFWQPLMAQVLVEGRVEPVSDREADAYFATRQRLSRIGAWASRQSQLLESRQALEAQVSEVEQRFEGREVPRPSYWSGYRVVPDMIEFWSSRQGRLHQRERYWQADGEWRYSLVNP